MDTNNKTDPVEALRCEALFGDWTKRTAAAYAYYQNHCATKGQMPLPWDALTQTAKNYWVSKSDSHQPNAKVRHARASEDAAPSVGQTPTNP